MTDATASIQEVVARRVCLASHSLARDTRYATPQAFWKSDEAVHVEDYLLHGNPRTQPDVFDLYLARVLEARSANEMHAALAKAHVGLMRLGIFQVRRRFWSFRTFHKGCRICGLCSTSRCIATRSSCW